MSRNFLLLIVSIAITACMLLPPQAVPVDQVMSWTYRSNGKLELRVIPDTGQLAQGWVTYEPETLTATVNGGDIVLKMVMRTTSRSVPAIVGYSIDIDNLPAGTYNVIDALTGKHLHTIDTSKIHEDLPT